MDFFEVVFDEMPEAVFIAEVSTGKIVYANKNSEKLLGLPKEKIIGLNQSEIHPKHLRNVYKEIFQEDSKVKNNFPSKRKTQRDVELTVQHVSGRIIPVEIYSQVFEFQNQRYIIGLFVNKAKTRKLERRIIALNEILLESERIFEQGSFQLSFRTHHAIFFFSDGAKNILQLPTNYVRITTIEELVIEEQREDFRNFILQKAHQLLKKYEQYKNQILEIEPLKKESGLSSEFIFYINGKYKVISFLIFFIRGKSCYGILKDVTSQKKQEEQIEIKTKHLKMLSECHKVLIYAQDEDMLLKQICKVVVETGEYLMCWIGFKKYDKEKNIEIVSYYTKAPQFQEYIRTLKLNWKEDHPYGRGPAGISCREGKIDIEKDIYFSDRFKPIKHLAIKLGMQSVIALPILVNERVIGTFVIYSSFPDAFDSEEVSILKELTVNLGVGISFIRERKTKLRLLEQNILLTKVLDNTNVGILIISKEGSILYINHKFEQMSGYLLNELLGKNINILKSGLHDQKFYEEIWNTLLAKRDWKGEIINKRKDGTLFLSRVFISPILGEKGEVSHFIEIVEDVTLEKYYEEQLEKTKFYDSLTDLPNRNFFIEKLNSRIRYQTPFYLFYLDIDHFSQITHSVGFIVSDSLLKQFSDSLKSFIEQEEKKDHIFLARMGNDEFGMILESYSVEEIVEFAERLLLYLKQTYYVQEKEFLLSASIGISIYPDNAQTPDELLRLAEISLKRAKEEKGDGNFAFLSKETEKEILEKAQIETLLQANVFYLQSRDKKKIKKTGFYIEYQPIFDLKTNQIVSLEALVRWKNPSMGYIPPSQFIPLAEKNRLIIPLGEFIIEEVVKQIVDWQEQGLPVIPVAINVSYIQLQQKEFLVFFKNLLKFYHVEPFFIELEITENAILQNENITRTILEELKKLRVTLLIDDFGMGYSSLSYLLKYKFDIIKIDQFFVQKLSNHASEDSQALNLIRAIIQVSRNFGLKTIAEGIENQEQKNILIQEGCNYGQGFYLSRPVEPQKIRKLLLKKS